MMVRIKEFQRRIDQSIGKPFLRSIPDKRDRQRLTVLSRLNRLEAQSIKMDAKLDRIILLLSRVAATSMGPTRNHQYPRHDDQFGNNDNSFLCCTRDSERNSNCSQNQNLQPYISCKLMRSTSVKDSSNTGNTSSENKSFIQKVFRSHSTKVAKKDLLSPDFQTWQRMAVSESSDESYVHACTSPTFFVPDHMQSTSLVHRRIGIGDIRSIFQY